MQEGERGIEQARDREKGKLKAGSMHCRLYRSWVEVTIFRYCLFMLMSSASREPAICPASLHYHSAGSHFSST